MKVNRKVSGGAPDAVELAMAIGMSRANATLAVPFLWITPGGSDPYSPTIIMMVEALQHSLRKLGVKTRGDGFVDKGMSSALERISGPHWKSKAWIQVFGDVIGKTDEPIPSMPMGDIEIGAVDDDGPSLFTLGAIGAAGWFLFLRKGSPFKI